MATARKPLKYKIAAIALGLLGLWQAGNALIGLARTAVFVHEAVVVEGIVSDVRQKPFDSWADTLGKGNLSCPGDTSYQPIVNFTMPSGLAVWYANLDPDNEDYAAGQPVSVIVPPDSPGKAKLNRWKFLWGADCLSLLAGALLLLPGWLILRPARGMRRAAPKAASRPEPRQASPTRRETTRPQQAKPRTAPAAESELPFTLISDSPEPRRKTPRKRKTGESPGEPKAPRKARSRKQPADGSSPAPKRRKPRSKTSEPG